MSRMCRDDVSTKGFNRIWLFDDNYYEDFKNWMGIEKAESLQILLAIETGEETIEDALNVLESVFWA